LLLAAVVDMIAQVRRLSHPQTINPVRGGHLSSDIGWGWGIVDEVGWATSVWSVGNEELKSSDATFKSTSQCLIWQGHKALHHRATWQWLGEALST